MDSLCIHCILVLQNCVSIPKEIIMFIILMMNSDNKKIYCGPKWTIFTINDDVYVCGKKKLIPKKQILNEIKSICYGDSHVVFIKKDKKIIYTCGKNDLNQLGLGDYMNRTTPQQIMFDFKSEIEVIACGISHTAIVTQVGEIYCWGYNLWGQLGLGDNLNCNFPHKLSISHVMSVSCGAYYTIILTKTECFSCGVNYYGQLGLGNNHDQYSMKKINGILNPILISCGSCHTVALTSDGVYSWGLNNHGQLGLGDDKNKHTPKKINLQGTLITLSIMSISCGSYHTTILTKRGELFVCGRNDFGQIGLDHKMNSFKFQKVNLNPNDLVLSIHCSRCLTIITTISGKYYGCGDNSKGKLGLGDTVNRFIFTEIKIPMLEILNQ